MGYDQVEAYQPDGYFGCPPCNKKDCCYKKEKCSSGCWSPCKKEYHEKEYYEKEYYEKDYGKDYGRDYGKKGYGCKGKSYNLGYPRYGSSCNCSGYYLGYGEDAVYGSGGCGNCAYTRCKTRCSENPFWEISGTDRPCLPGTPSAKLHKALGHNLARRSGQQYTDKILYVNAYGSWS